MRKACQKKACFCSLCNGQYQYGTRQRHRHRQRDREQSDEKRGAIPAVENGSEDSSGSETKDVRNNDNDGEDREPESKDSDDERRATSDELPETHLKHLSRVRSALDALATAEAKLNAGIDIWQQRADTLLLQLLDKKILHSETDVSFVGTLRILHNQLTPLLPELMKRLPKTLKTALASLRSRTPPYQVIDCCPAECGRIFHTRHG